MLSTASISLPRQTWPIIGLLEFRLIIGLIYRVKWIHKKQVQIPRRRWSWCWQCDLRPRAEPSKDCVTVEIDNYQLTTYLDVTVGLDSPTHCTCTSWPQSWTALSELWFSFVKISTCNKCSHTCYRRLPSSWNILPASPASYQSATHALPASSAGSSAGCSASACSRPPDSPRASRRSPSLLILK